MDDEIAEIVREHGWYAASVSDHKPPFLYTIGLMQTCKHPEFIMFGLDADNAHALFSCLVRNIRAGQSYAEPGVYTINLGGGAHRVGFRRVHPTQHPLYLGFAMGFLTNIGRMGELEAVQASLDPEDHENGNTPDRFHGYGILGRVAVESARERARIGRALVAGNRRTGTSFLCFDPHIGVLATRGGQRVSLAACFWCGNVEVVMPGIERGIFPLSGWPSRLLLRHLRAAGITMAKPPE